MVLLAPGRGHKFTPDYRIGRERKLFCVILKINFVPEAAWIFSSPVMRIDSKLSDIIFAIFLY